MDAHALNHCLSIGMSQYKAGSLDEAEKTFISILRENPSEANSLNLLGCINRDRGKIQESVALMQQAIQADSSNPYPYINLGKILLSLGRYADAAGVFQASINCKSDIPEAWFCFGNSLKNLAKNEEAIIAFKNTIALTSSHGGGFAILLAF